MEYIAVVETKGPSSMGDTQGPNRVFVTAGTQKELKQKIMGFDGVLSVSCLKTEHVVSYDFGAPEDYKKWIKKVAL